ncbi:exodeoxyribonuclease V subunit gamma [Streptomyces purpurogeneiscleroticus]|uniref:exodeoxyribonuclease V subunit gamma n=1 Tax=Streptomyces purpurogeneiscleroticus TaxID=68259 RepID=UPI001CBDB09E|nr:exodeoxyribonuclease V subunit gamma [Streptomyces purpurogeneiscleroticus]
MLDQALMALASAAGVAVAQAAGTDAWQSFRERVARLLGRGPAPDAAQARFLERLDRTAAELESTDIDQADRVRGQVAASWQARFQDLLEDLNDVDRQRAAAQLRDVVALVGQAAADGLVGDENVAIGGDAHVQAESGSAAAVQMHARDMTFSTPPLPGPEGKRG